LDFMRREFRILVQIKIQGVGFGINGLHLGVGRGSLSPAEGAQHYNQERACQSHCGRMISILVWGGHSCPPPLTLTLLSKLSTEPKSDQRNSKSKAKVKSVGQECPTHTFFPSHNLLLLPFQRFPDSNRARFAAIDSCRRAAVPFSSMAVACTSGRASSAGSTSRHENRWSVPAEQCSTFRAQATQHLTRRRKREY
jgi:hypothetical protein